MRNIEKHLATTDTSSHKDTALCVQDLQNLYEKFGDEFSNPWQDERVRHCGKNQVSTVFQMRIGDAFEALYKKIQILRHEITTVNDPLTTSFEERTTKTLNRIIATACFGEMSSSVRVDRWTSLAHKHSHFSDRIEAKHRFSGRSSALLLTIPYSFIPRIKRGIVFTDNKIVLKSWDEDRAVDGCTSEACQYSAMTRQRQYETRNGFVAYMEVEDSETIAAIRETRDKACGAVRGKIRKATLERLGLA